MKLVHRALRWALITLAGTMLLLFLFTAVCYQRIFGRRFEADARPLGLLVSDFSGLIAQPIAFASGDALLRGNFYRSGHATRSVDALLIFCHGFSNGSRDYLAQINFFAEQGFVVLAYDNTGCYASSGAGVGGIPMAAENLRDVLTALGEEAEYASTPLVLVGHSWGGYAVNAVLARGGYENVKAVVSFSAPNESLSMLIEQGRSLFGDAIELLRPFLWLVEQIKFGAYSTDTALDGVNRTSAAVLALHSQDDPVVRFPCSLAAQAPLSANPRALFLPLSDKGHNIALSEAARAYAAALRLRLGDALKDHASPERSLETASHMLLYQLDPAVMQQVLQFILASLAAPI